MAKSVALGFCVTACAQKVIVPVEDLSDAMEKPPVIVLGVLAMRSSVAANMAPRSSWPVPRSGTSGRMVVEALGITSPSWAKLAGATLRSSERLAVVPS